MELKIKLKVKGVEIEMDEADAEELHKFLNKIYGKKEKEPVYIPTPYPVHRWSSWPYYDVTWTSCSDTSGTFDTTSGQTQITYSMSS